MAKLEQLVDNDVESPLWLTEMLRESRDYLLFQGAGEEAIDDEFRRRCRKAAAVAFSLSQLREERERIGFVPLSLSAYIQGLLKLTNVALEPTLEFLGVEQLTQISCASASASGLARLARGLGIELREALIHLRVGFAEQIDGAPMPLLMARHRSAGGGRSNLEECESVLGDVESTYDLNTLRELRRTEFEFRSGYKETIGT